MRPARPAPVQRAGAGIVAQHVQHEKARFGGKQPLVARPLTFVGISMQGLQQAAIGQHRIRGNEFAHAQFVAAEDHGQPVVLRGGEAAHTGVYEKLVKRDVTDAGEQLDRRHVAAGDQRLLRFDRTHKAAVEILRRVRGEACRRVLEQAGGVDDSALDRQGVDEGFERRSRRAFSARAVDLAVNRRIEEIRRAERGEHLHRAIVDQHRAGVLNPSGTPAIDVSGKLPFQHRLAV